MEFLNEKFPESKRQELPVNRESCAQEASTLKEQLERQVCKLEPKVSDCKYSLLQRIGEGVFGEVYLGSLKTNLKGTQYALKKISKSHPKFRKASITREIAAGKLLQHPCIIRFEESFETGSSVYLVMEYFHSDDLYSVLEDREFEPFTENESKKMFRQLIAALVYSHSKGVAHRDVKLENMLIDKSGQIKLIDFGLCDFVFDGNRQLKLSMESVGSPAYIAPEILKARPYNAIKSDVWSSGVVLFALLFGRFPFSSYQYECMASGEALAVQFPDGKEVSQSVKDLLSGMLELNPEKRMDMQQVDEHGWLRNYTECTS